MAIAKATNKQEYIPLALSPKNNRNKTVPNVNGVVNNLVKQLNRFKKDKINIFSLLSPSTRDAAFTVASFFYF